MTRKQEQFRFFFSHAGYSYDPKTQTKMQGRAACARKMAEAERYFDAHNWRIEWIDDFDGKHDEDNCDCRERSWFGEGHDSACPARRPNTCEGAILYDPQNNVLASLWCIDDADSDYRRVIRAELALEAMSNEQDVKKYGLLA